MPYFNGGMRRSYFPHRRSYLLASYTGVLHYMHMNTRTTAAVGGIGVLAFMLVGIGLWHVAGVLDSVTNANVDVALQAATETPAQQGAVTPAARVLPRLPRPIATGAASAATETEQTVSEPVSVAGVGTLMSLLSFRSNLTCAVSTTGPGLYRAGTVYVSDGELRGDFVTTGSGVRSSMIDAGGYLYAWMSAGTHGVRLLAASSASASAIVAYGGINPIQQVSYSCNLWKADLSEFTPPSAVTYTDTAGN